MDYDYENTTETGYFFNFRDANPIYHLKVKHPKDVRPYIGKLPALESIEFDYSGSAFKASYDKFSQIDQALRKSRLKAFTISNAKKLDALPEILNQHKIKSFSIKNCPLLSDFEQIVDDLPHLENLRLSNYSGGFSGNFFHKLPNLKKLYISCKSIESFEGIENCKNLEQLEIESLSNEFLKFPFSNFKNLKYLGLRQMTNLEQLPDLKNNSKIVKIYLQGLPKLKNKFFDFQSKKELKTLSIYRVGNKTNEVEFSESFGDCENLTEVMIHDFGLKNLPLRPNTLKKTHRFELGKLPFLKEIPDAFEKASEIEHFHLNELPSLISIPKSIGALIKMKRFGISILNTADFDIDISNCESLEQININNISNLTEIDSSITKLKNLKEVNLYNLDRLKKLPEFGNNNSNLESLKINSCKNITLFTESIFECEKLKRLEFDGLSLNEIPVGFSKMNSLYSLALRNIETLKSLPLDIMSASSISNFYTQGSTHIESKFYSNQGDFFSKAKKSLEPSLLPYFFYCITNGFENIALSDEIKLGVLKCLTSKSPNARSVIFQQLYKLNPNQKAFSPDQIKPGESVIILGKPDSAITPLKKKMKDLGLNPVTKLTDEIRLVLVGKSPQIPDDFFASERILFKESELESVSKKLNPQLLQKEETPKEFIENLRQLLWSNDSNNYAVALELVKNNGLPDLAQDDFLYVSKTCKDKNLKARIRKFLKGKLSEDRVQAISSGGSNFKVGKLGNILSKESLANMHFAHFKTTGEIDTSFFWSAAADHPGRKEVFEKHIESYLIRPHYLQIYPLHTIEEFNIIFSNPIFKGQLKRLILNHTLPEFPIKLLLHLETLSDLTINFDEGITVLPKEIYQFKKLKKLTISAHHTSEIPEGFSQMNRLGYFRIYSKKPITIPIDFIELKKLKEFHCQGKVENLETIKGKMPLLKI